MFTRPGLRVRTDADLRKIARAVAERENSAPVSVDDVYDYQSGAALGFRPPVGTLGYDTAAVGPALITGGHAVHSARGAASGGITSSRSRGPAKPPRPQTCRYCPRSRFAPACRKKSNRPAERGANCPASPTEARKGGAKHTALSYHTQAAGPARAGGGHDARRRQSAHDDAFRTAPLHAVGSVCDEAHFIAPPASTNKKRRALDVRSSDRIHYADL